MSKKILWCGNSYYGSPFKVGCNYYSELLAKGGNKVLFIAPPISPFHNKINEATRLAQAKKGLHEIFENYFIYTPFALIPPFKKLPSQFYWIIKIWCPPVTLFYSFMTAVGILRMPVPTEHL